MSEILHKTEADTIKFKAWALSLNIGLTADSFTLSNGCYTNASIELLYSIFVLVKNCPDQGKSGDLAIAIEQWASKYMVK